MNKQHTVLVIGGGPGGYVAAIRAAQLGGQVTLVEKDQLGGTCLNVGCIPTKSLLHGAEYVNAVQAAKEYGIHLELKKVDWPAVVAKKDAVVNTLVGGVSGLLTKNRVRIIKGQAVFTGRKEVTVHTQDGSHLVLQAEKIILASGSVPAVPPIPGLNESKYTITSNQALSLDQLPERMLILGGGVIGVELACAFRAFGCAVTVIEALPRLVPSMDGEISLALAKSLEAQGIDLHLNSKVVQVNDLDGEVCVTVACEGTQQKYCAQKLLVAVGRRAHTSNLGLEQIGIQTDRGRVEVNEFLETSVPGVYAIGDCLGKVMLAHTASAQGERAAENAMGQKKAYAPQCCPACLYTFPEAAGVGLTEESAKENNLAFHIGKFPLKANGRTLITNGGAGFVKIIVGDELDEILGVHIFGPFATEMIGEAALAIEMEATVDELIETIHAHPTISEALREAALTSCNRAIHIPNRNKL